MACTDFSRPSPRPPASPLTWIAGLLPIDAMRRDARTDLRRLSDRSLNDIGLNRHDIATVVDREIGRLRLDEFRSRL